MSIQDLGAIGEVIGAIAVVCSLAYLAVQIRNQNRESRAAAMHDISVGFRESVAAFGTPAVAEIFTRFNNGEDEWSDAERIQLMSCMQRNLRVWEEAYVQYSKGRLDHDIWRAMDRQYTSLFSSRAGKWAWSLRNEFYIDSFRGHVEALNEIEYRIR